MMQQQQQQQQQPLIWMIDRMSDRSPHRASPQRNATRPPAKLQCYLFRQRTYFLQPCQISQQAKVPETMYPRCGPAS